MSYDLTEPQETVNDSLGMRISEILSNNLKIDQSILQFYPDFYSNAKNSLIRLYFDKYLTERNQYPEKKFLFFYSEKSLFSTIGISLIPFFITPYVERINRLSEKDFAEVARKSGRIVFGLGNEDKFNIQNLKRKTPAGDFIFPRNRRTATITLSGISENASAPCPFLIWACPSDWTAETYQRSPILPSSLYRANEYDEKKPEELPWAVLSVPLIIISSKKQFQELFKTLFSNGKTLSDTFPTAEYIEKHGQSNLNRNNPIGETPSIINVRDIFDAQHYINTYKLKQFNIISLGTDLQLLKPVHIHNALHLVEIDDIEDFFDPEEMNVIAGKKTCGSVGILTKEVFQAFNIADHAAVYQNPSRVIPVNVSEEIDNAMQSILKDLKSVKKIISQNNDDSIMQLFFIGRKLLNMMFYPVLPEKNIKMSFEMLETADISPENETADHLGKELKTLYDLLKNAQHTPKFTAMRSFLQELAAGYNKISLIINMLNPMEKELFESFVSNNFSRPLRRKFDYISRATEQPVENAIYTQCGKTPLQKKHFLFPRHLNSYWFLYPVENKILQSLVRRYQQLLKQNHLDISSVFADLGMEYNLPAAVTDQPDVPASPLTVDYNFNDPDAEDFDIFTNNLNINSANTYTLLSRIIQLENGRILCTEEFEIYVPAKKTMLFCQNIQIGDEILVETVEARDQVFQKLVAESEDQLNKKINRTCPLLNEWHRRLNQFMQDNGYDSAKLCSILREDYDLEVTPQTVNNWRNGEVRSPRQFEKLLEALADIIHDEELRIQAKDIVKYANKINSTNQQVGMDLKREIYEALIQGKTEYNDIPIEQFFRLSKVVDIIAADDELYPRYQTNVFIKTNQKETN